MSDDDLDWLNDLSEPVPSEPADEVPDWLAGLGEPTVPQIEEAATQGEPAPDWLNDLSEPAPVPSEPAPVSVSFVDDPWSVEAAAESTPSEPANEIPDWLRGIEEPAPAPSEPTTEVPDWLADLNQISPQIFISYSREDWAQYVEKLAAHLKGCGFNIWVDQHLLRGGDEWIRKIDQALDSSAYLILCLSPDALASKWVRMEYTYFITEDKPIIPVMCRAVARLPFELRGIQYHPYELDKLADLLRELVKVSG